MTNLLQSSQTAATTAPSFYTDYLNNLATTGTQAQQNAQYVGAQPLQEQAFNAVAGEPGTGQPLVNQGAGLVGGATDTSTLGAAQPYLTGAATSGGLSAANPYLTSAATGSPAELAQQYMSPYLNTAVQSLSDIAQRNIQRNLDPMATAAGVGSGQFGSQRGAQVLGQINESAQQDLESQIANMENSAYGQALGAGTSQQALLGQLGSTAGTLQQQQAGVLGQAANTAGNLTAQQQQNEIAAGQNLGTLGQTSQNMSLADINALSTLGGQQQTIGQNQQNYPLSTLSSLSQLLQGYNMPSTTTTQMNASPLSSLAALASTAGGIASNPTLSNGISSIWNSLTGSGGTGSTGTTSPTLPLDNTQLTDPSGNPITYDASGDPITNQSSGFAKGGSVRGGLPTRSK